MFKSAIPSGKPWIEIWKMWLGICLLMVIAIVALPEIALASKAMKSVTFNASGAIEVASIYETSFAAQKSTMKSLKTLSKSMKKAPGFKGSLVLQSQDGKQVITLSQWQDLASYQTFTLPPIASSKATLSTTALPAPTQTLTFELATAQPSLPNTTPALRGKQAVVQLIQFVAKQPDTFPQLLEQIEGLIPNLLQKQPIPQSVVLLQSLESEAAALLVNWNCSPMFEDVGQPTVIDPGAALVALADVKQQLFNVATLLPVEAEKPKEDD